MKRVILGGILAGLAPTAYFFAQLVDGVVGAALAGLVLARLVRPASASAA